LVSYKYSNLTATPDNDDRNGVEQEVLKLIGISLSMAKICQFHHQFP
jgi:hypothetical protein